MIFNDDGDYYTVVFKVKDKEAWEPYRRKLCELMMANPPAEPIVKGAFACNIGYGNRARDLRQAEHYIDYIHECLDSSVNSWDILSFEDWLNEKATAEQKK